MTNPVFCLSFSCVGLMACATGTGFGTVTGANGPLLKYSQYDSQSVLPLMMLVPPTMTSAFVGESAQCENR